MSTTEPTLEYVVTGMTCGHCTASVKEEVGEVAGVTAVDVDLTSGRVGVHGADIDEEAVVAAVREAGYKVID